MKKLALTASAQVIVSLSLAFMPMLTMHCEMTTMYKLRALFYCTCIPLISQYLTYLNQRDNSTSTKYPIVLSFIFSQFISIGSLEFLTHSFFSDIFNIYKFIYWVGSSAIWSCILYPIIKFCTIWLNNYKIDNNKGINYKKIFFVAIAIRLICLVLFYPCIFDFDSGFGLRTMLKPGEIITNHHPYAVQYVHYLFFKFGKSIGSPSVGFAILSLIFIIVSASIIIYSTKAVQYLKVGRKIVGFIGYTLAIFPIFPVVSVYCTKDGFFAYFFLLFLATQLVIYTSKAECLKNFRFFFLYTLTIIILCLTRHQGLYIVAIQTLALLWIYRKQFISVLFSSIPGLVTVVMFNMVLLPSLNVEPTNKKEAYNMLFQQTARSLVDNPEKVTKENMSIIGAILPTDSIKKHYRYIITDDVKKFYHYTEGSDSVYKDGLLHFRHVDHTGENEALKAYRRTWAKMLFEHTGSYFDAVLCVSTPFFFNTGLSLQAFDTNWISSKATSPEYGFSQAQTTSHILSQVNGYLSNFPITDLLFGLPLYNWCCILLLSLLIYRKDKCGITVFLPVLLSLCLLFISPVACGRYILPIIFSLPLIFAYTLKTDKENE